MEFMNRLRKLLRHRTEPHKTAHDYWRQCGNSFLAGDPTYYDRQEVALRGLVRSIKPAPTTALDVGCGSGRFSIVLAEKAAEVVAFDLSQQLIETATAAAQAQQVVNVHFEVRDLEDGFPKRAPSDLVACMGVVSTLIDDHAFNGLLGNLQKATRSGGHLITKDSLSREADIAITSGPYVTVYRSWRRYEDAVSKAGFELVRKQELAADERLINHLYLWRRVKAS
ncbi:MAG: methyltransferase domain-containing protein [Pseudomonadota bacterium]